MKVEDVGDAEGEAEDDAEYAGPVRGGSEKSLDGLWHARLLLPLPVYTCIGPGQPMSQRNFGIPCNHSLKFLDLNSSASVIVLSGCCYLEKGAMLQCVWYACSCTLALSLLLTARFQLLSLPGGDGALRAISVGKAS